jgi:hypothetical protein
LCSFGAFPFFTALLSPRADPFPPLQLHSGGLSPSAFSHDTQDSSLVRGFSLTVRKASSDSESTAPGHRPFPAPVFVHLFSRLTIAFCAVRDHKSTYIAFSFLSVIAVAIARRLLPLLLLPSFSRLPQVPLSSAAEHPSSNHRLRRTLAQAVKELLSLLCPSPLALKDLAMSHRLPPSSSPPPHQAPTQLDISDDPLSTCIALDAAVWHAVANRDGQRLRLEALGGVFVGALLPTPNSIIEADISAEQVLWRSPLSSGRTSSGGLWLSTTRR